MSKAKSFLIACTFCTLITSCAQSAHNVQELAYKNSEYYYNEGMASMMAKNYADAIANFKKAILKDQNNYKAYDKLALAYASVDEYNRAIRNINRAMKINPNYYQAILDKAAILQADNQTTEAINTLNKCITNDYCNLKPQAYYQLANIYKSKGDITDYINNLNLAILYYRDFSIARFDLAKAYVDNHMCRNETIEQKVMYLLNNQNTNSEYQNYLEILLLKAKCYIEARKLQQATKLIQTILFKDNIPQQYKKQAINLSKKLIILEYMARYNNSPQQNIGFAPSVPQNIRVTNKTNNIHNLNTIRQSNNAQATSQPIINNHTIQDNGVVYYQLGFDYTRDDAYDTYEKAKQLGFDVYMVQNNKGIIIFAKVPKDKIALLLKYFPTALKILQPQQVLSLKRIQ